MFENKQGNRDDRQEGDVLNQDGCERQSYLDVATEALVEELKDLFCCVNLVRANKPLIFLFIELLCIISLNFSKRYGQVRNSLEAMLKEVSVILLGVVHHTEEYGSLDLVLVLEV